MSSELKQSDNPFPLPKINGMNVGIVVAEWNHKFTEAMLKGALDLFQNEGYPEEDIQVYHVPGTIELTFAASQLIKTGDCDVIIVLGCVIRGETPHFSCVCDSVTQGVAYLNATSRIPVIFGVITVDNEQQAIDRTGGVYGNKGTEAAEAAIKMCAFVREIH